jgi:short-subunit dehydrogenase
MSFILRASTKACVLVGVLLAGCANDGSGPSLFTTGALGGSGEPGATASAEPKVDAQCVALVSRIETLRKEGIAEKIEKATAKKYKMTNADLAKADQLNKANAEFQMRCSTITPRTAAAGPAPRPPTTN